MTRVACAAAPFMHCLLPALCICGAACSAPTQCDARAFGFGAQSVGSAPEHGSLRLAALGQQQTLTFRASLAGLPKLWPSNSAISQGRFGLAAKLSYDAAPVGGDGKTEMPRVRVLLPTSTEAGGYFAGAETPAYPGPNASAFGRPLFENCSSPHDDNCCVFGAEQCEVLVDVMLVRLDGEPFPPLNVAWSASAGALVGTCPSEPSMASAALSLVSP